MTISPSRTGQNQKGIQSLKTLVRAGNNKRLSKLIKQTKGQTWNKNIGQLKTTK